jgi:excisionase family DNA binding protein
MNSHNITSGTRVRRVVSPVLAILAHAVYPDVLWHATHSSCNLSISVTAVTADSAQGEDDTVDMGTDLRTYYLSLSQAAARLGGCRRTVLRAAARGELQAAFHTPGGYHRFHPTDVEANARRLATVRDGDGTS